MLWLIFISIVFIAAATVCVYSMVKSKDDLLVNAFKYGFITIAVVFVISMFFNLAVPMNNYEFTDKAILKDMTEIKCLNDNLDTEGRITGNIFITSGTIENNQYYYYMHKTDNGLKADKIAADDTYVVEIDTNKETPRVESYVYEGKVNETLMFWLTYQWGGDYDTKYIFAYYKLYVPENSITSEYSIDLK